MVCRYVPILRWKRGELRGLQRVRPGLRNNTAPLFVIIDNTYKRRAFLAKISNPSEPEAIAADIEVAWGNKPFFVDASEVAATRGAHMLGDLVSRCLLRKLNPVLATTLDADPHYTQAVINDARTRHVGAALRVTLLEAAAVSSIVQTWGLPPRETDLIVDLRDAADEAVATLNGVIHILSQVCSAGPWRSVTVVGTSMPENFGGMPPGTHELRRHEWSVWNGIRQAGLPRDVDYGDYATVPYQIADVPEYARFSVNVRYTLKDRFLIRRGVPFRGPGSRPMREQLREHAQAIVAHPRRAPLPGCWADEEVDRVAAGDGSSGNLESWVAIGVCRHVERVRTDLP